MLAPDQPKPAEPRIAAKLEGQDGVVPKVSLPVGLAKQVMALPQTERLQLATRLVEVKELERENWVASYMAERARRVGLENKRRERKALASGQRKKLESKRKRERANRKRGRR